MIIIRIKLCNILNKSITKLSSSKYSNKNAIIDLQIILINLNKKKVLYTGITNNSKIKFMQGHSI